MKPENMKSVTRSATSLDQKDRGLGFNGQDNTDRIQTKTSKFSGNYHGGDAEGNFGRGPTVGNTGKLIEGPATPPTRGVPNFKAAMGANDKLNFGKQERTPGGTRSFDPKMGQNYSGNADMIREGRGPVKGNGQGTAK